LILTRMTIFIVVTFWQGDKNMMPQLTTAQRICCTSVQDGLATIKAETQLTVLREALEYELKHGLRTTMLKAMNARIKKIQNSSEDLK